MVRKFATCLIVKSRQDTSKQGDMLLLEKSLFARLKPARQISLFTRLLSPCLLSTDSMSETRET